MECFLYGLEYDECSCFYVQVARVRADFFVFYLTLPLYDVEYTTTELMPRTCTESSRFIHMVYTAVVRVYALLPPVQPLNKTKTKSRRREPRLTDNRCARASFEITTTHSLRSFFLWRIRWLLAAISLQLYQIEAGFRTRHPMRTR